MKNPGGSYDGHESNKHVKLGKPAARKTASSPMKNTHNSSQNLVAPSKNYEESKFQNQFNVLGIGSKKKNADTKPILDPSLSLKVSNDDAPTSVTEANNIDKEKVGVHQSKNISDKYKEAGASADASPLKYREKSAYGHSKSQPGRPSSHTDNLEGTGRSKEKNGIYELPDLNLSEAKHAMQAAVSSCLLLFFVVGLFKF